MLVGDDARTEVLISAADLATRTLSYDYKTFDERHGDGPRADDEVVPQGVRRDDGAGQGQHREEQDRPAGDARCPPAIISATEHKAKVLVFLNQTTTAGVGETAKQQASQNSLVVTLTRGDGDWAISKLTALG